MDSFPEEMNWVVADAICELHFAPTRQACEYPGNVTFESVTLRKGLLRARLRGLAPLSMTGESSIVEVFTARETPDATIQVMGNTVIDALLKMASRLWTLPL